MAQYTHYNLNKYENCSRATHSLSQVNSSFFATPHYKLTQYMTLDCNLYSLQPMIHIGLST